jgi:hypothetical protein
MRVREFRHLFAGTRAITATLHIDPEAARLNPRSLGCLRVEWDGSKERQPSAELFEEFRQWIDGVYRWLATELGTGLSLPLENPDGSLELWLYDPGKPPRLAREARNTSGLPLATILFGLPDWDDQKEGA